MTETQPSLSTVVERTLTHAADPATVPPPEPVEVRVERAGGDVAVTSDGAGVRVELRSPLRLTAPELQDAINQAADEALERARAAVLGQLDEALGEQSIASLTGLGTELREAYDLELVALDERIDKVAQQ
ncbi:hypothetical protein [uncultured Tessaracoccus sp.]|uniref:hypothetical protein n=1 Tax=uncultured Tessaracoccus sp. TaxID=905023 RepID=UPI0025E0AD71|nr:hypothetical protein [uncultured Tessaracoccus sp.]